MEAAKTAQSLAHLLEPLWDHPPQDKFPRTQILRDLDQGVGDQLDPEVLLVVIMYSLAQVALMIVTPTPIARKIITDKESSANLKW